jgi:predicted dinucleotide-binding enzyme
LGTSAGTASPNNGSSQRQEAHFSSRIRQFANDPSLLASGHTDSGGEQVARWASGAKVVKAFNTYGFENFADSSYASYANLKPVMLVAGDDPDAKKTVSQLAMDIGFQPLDTGSLKMARYLEPTGMLWIEITRTQKLGPNFTWPLSCGVNWSLALDGEAVLTASLK